MTQDIEGLRAVLAAYGCAKASLEPLGNGLINLTWLVRTADGQPCVLQRVADIFPAEINRDIAVVADTLAQRGVQAPGVVPCLSGQLWVEEAGYNWRMLTWLKGRCYESLSSSLQARSAGALLARFHRALDGLDHEFANPRLGVHDTARHLSALRDALVNHPAHPRRAQIAPLAESILAAAASLPVLPPSRDRIVHGDPKINNMLFDESSGEASSLVDLDTVGLMPLPLELGDALRSWCNPTGENGRLGEFSAELFAAALTGYAAAAGDWIEAAEIRAIMPATETIIIELAARFCADAFNENYFGWDASRFTTRSEHNEV
ncbi:MAG: phosphotransferase enzyme family protein, partial [Gammaproteobacteria bacterium]